MKRGFKDLIHIRCADHRMHRALTKDFYEHSAGRRVKELRGKLMGVYGQLLFRKAFVTKLGTTK